MQTTLRILSVFALATIMGISSCKKDESPEQEPDQPDVATQIAVHSNDQNRVSSDMDMVVNDIIEKLEETSSFSGKQSGPTSICNALAVADTANSIWKITINYTGNNCANTHHRSGVVVVSMPANTRWKNAGATITVAYQNLVVKRLSDNNSIKLNGAFSLTNQNGGLLVNLPALNNITHLLSSTGITITFDNNTQRVWQVARKKVFTYQNGIALTVHGNHTIGTNTQVTEWGINRYGNAFTTSITQPIVIRQDCSMRVTAGEIKHEGFATATATFGLNASGAPTGCPVSSNYFMRLVWTPPNGNAQSIILPY